MEIKIDTKKDSRDDIQKIILFLKRFIEETSSYSEDSGIGEDNVSPGAMDMFNDIPRPPDEKKDDDDARIEIIEY